MHASNRSRQKADGPLASGRRRAPFRTEGLADAGSNACLSRRYPDLLIHAPGHGVEAIEVKTGMDPPLTWAQRWYYPVLQVGNHLYSDDFRIAQLGLIPGEPFPPMIVHRIYTPGPGQPYDIKQLDPPEFLP